MQHSLAAALLALALAGCEAPPVFVSPAYDQAWAQQRRLCQGTPQAAHCDIYLRNELPPAPYSADGILIEQRQRCFETRSVADCSLALSLGREAAGRAAGPAPVAEQRDDGFAPLPAVASEPDDAPEPAPRPRRRAAPAEAATAQCTPAALDALDLVEAPVRAAILRRCGAARRAGAAPE